MMRYIIGCFMLQNFGKLALLQMCRAFFMVINFGSF